MVEGHEVFGFVVRHKRSNETLGEAHGHRQKKVAKKVAYMRTYENPDLERLIASERAEPEPPPDPISALYICIQRFGYTTEYLKSTAREIASNSTNLNAHLFEASFATPEGAVLGSATGPTKAAAKAAAAQVALAHLKAHPLPPASEALPPASEALPPAPPAPSMPPLAGGPPELSESQRAICAILGEMNVNFQGKLARLMTKSGKDDAELVALAQVHTLSAAQAGGHSAGRRFHDELKAMIAAAEKGDVFLSSTDLV